MSEASKAARTAMKSKIARLISPGKKSKIDASDFTPADPLDTESKTGLRPLSRRQFKKGGKVVAKAHGEEAHKHAGRKPRKNGGKALTADTLINRDVREANEERDGTKHIGGFKRGGATKGRKHREDGGSTAMTRSQLPGDGTALLARTERRTRSGVCSGIRFVPFLNRG